MTTGPALDYAALHSVPTAQQPFPHFICHNSIVPSHSGQLQDAFPELPGAGSVPLDQLRCSTAFLQFIDELEGEQLREILAEKLAIDLRGRPVVITARSQLRPRDGRIHTDSRSKLVTVLMYFNAQWTHAGGRLRLLNAADNMDDYFAEVAPLTGAMVAFKVTDNGWHGHLPVTGQRLSLQLNYLRDDAALGKHARLHTLSAWMKRMRNRQ